jgi:hypothetical protein
VQAFAVWLRLTQQQRAQQVQHHPRLSLGPGAVALAAACQAKGNRLLRQRLLAPQRHLHLLLVVQQVSLVAVGGQHMQAVRVTGGRPPRVPSRAGLVLLVLGVLVLGVLRVLVLVRLLLGSCHHLSRGQPNSLPLPVALTLPPLRTARCARCACCARRRQLSAGRPGRQRRLQVPGGSTC